MAKKRGGRRGKASAAPKEEEPKPSTSSLTPQETSTSQQPPPQKPEQPKPIPEQQFQNISNPQSSQQQQEIASGRSQQQSKPWPSTSQQTSGVSEPQRSTWGTQQSRQPQGRGRPRESWGKPAPTGGRGRPYSQYAVQELTQPSKPREAWGKEQTKSWPAKETPLIEEQFKKLTLKGQPTDGRSQQPRQQGGRAGAVSASQSSSVSGTPTASLSEEKSYSTPISDEEFKELLPYKPGTAGRKIIVETNHLKLDLGTLKQAYRYDVSIEPDKPKKMLKMAMELFRRAYFPNNNPSYDGQKLLYSAKRLPLSEDTISDSVKLIEDNGKEKEFKIMIKLTGTLDLSLLNVNNLLQKNIELGDVFQCVEVVFRQAYVSSFVTVGRRFYTPPARMGQFRVGDGGEMYLGGYQAAVKGYKYFLNVDVAHKAFTLPVNVKDLVNDMFNRTPLRDEEMKNFFMKSWQCEQMTKYLKGLKVVYQIPNHPSSKRVYKVNGLDRSPSEATFKENNRNITVEAYFQKKYNYKIKYPNLPTLWVGAKGTILIPMECCTLKEGQPIDGGRMTDNQVRKMIRYAATSTTERKKKIQDIINKAGYNRNPCIEEFGFSVSDEFQKVNARVLAPPELKYLNGTAVPTKGEWKGKQFIRGAEIKTWTIVAVGLQPDRVQGDISRLAKMIYDYGRSNGMTLSKPLQPFNYCDPRDLYRCFQEKKKCDLIIVVISSFNKDVYYMVKQIAEQTVGCLTQCIKSDTLRKLNQSTIVNILLKINSKLNGTNHILCDLELLTKEPVMVMGADVTHPSPQSKSLHPSVVAVTASHDLTATAYNINVRLQKPREMMSEMIQDLEEITLTKLRRFKKGTEKEPVEIFFFRDGVSEGEFDRVKEVEIRAIMNACNRFRQGYKPKITFVVVQKRHHTRLFPIDKNRSDDYDKNFNAPAGTCVDTDIVDPLMLNFYLLSHASIQGVARPTKYCGLLDENNLSNDDIQKLIYYLCHVFMRCNRAVSYPAPTYYAHLAADRAKGYLHGKQINMDVLDQTLIKIKEDFAESKPMFFT